MTLKWHLLTSNDLQFYLECYKCVLRPRNRYETCATLIFSKVLKSQKFKKKRKFGGHLGNGGITEKALVTGFYFWSKLFTRGVPHLKIWCFGLNIFSPLKVISEAV